LGLGGGLFGIQGKGDQLPLDTTKEGNTTMADMAMEQEGSLISMQNDSQVTDPVSSLVGDNPSMGDPPTKMTMLGSPRLGHDEEQEDGEATESEGDEMVPKGDLLKEAMADMQLVQGLRSKAIPYTRRKKVVTVMAVRKSGRTWGTNANMSALEKAQRLAAEKNLEKNVAKAKDKAKGNPFLFLMFFRTLFF
jgi:hypothetical protein